MSSFATVAALAKKARPHVHLIRSFLHLVVVMMLMAALAMPVLNKVALIPAGPTRVMEIHYEYLLFQYRYWSAGTMKPDSLRKARTSIGVVAAGTAFVALGPLLTMIKLNRTIIALFLTAIVCFIYSVVNMRIGYHFFNESSGSLYTGRIGWGPSQTFHVLVAILAFLPMSFLLLERCIAMPAFITPQIRRALLAVPMIIATVFAVTGAGEAQAINHKSSVYTTAWHYDTMTYDYDMKYVKDTFCTEFYGKQAGAAACTTIACFFAFVAWVLSIFLTKRPFVALVFVILSFMLTIPALGATSTLRNPIVCETNPRSTKNQGDLSLTHGFTCLIIAMVAGFIDVVFSFLTRGIGEGEDEADVDVKPTQAIAAAASTEPTSESVMSLPVAAEKDGKEMVTIEEGVVVVA